MAKEKKKGLVKEFKEFISKGNVLDMAVGVIIATAFGKITASLINDVLMPFIGWIIGDYDLSALNITLSPAVLEGGEVIKEAVVIGIGTLLTAVLDFVLISLVVFLIAKALNKAKERAEAKKKAEEAAAPAAPAEPSDEILLLREIRDSLKK